MEALLILLIALALDLSLGEPPAPIHPVVWMGKLISVSEKLSGAGSRAVRFISGLIVTLLITGLFTAAGFYVLFYAGRLHPAAYVVIGALLLKSVFSLKELKNTALRVKKLLVSGKPEELRLEMRALVSRETGSLSRPLIVSAAVESVAESTCDSFVAPLFYFALFGVPGAIAYRAINTLDAMIGYHGKYEYFGKFAARLDDVLNYIPARLTALLLVFAALFSGGSRSAWRVSLSDHSRTESPNAGWPIAAAAGALDVQLRKEGHYIIGSPGAALVPETIDAALRLSRIAAFTWAVVCFAAGGIYFAVTA
jgi:adenosylcobinamide-phosphate synthase